MVTFLGQGKGLCPLPLKGLLLQSLHRNKKIDFTSEQKIGFTSTALLEKGYLLH